MNDWITVAQYLRYSPSRGMFVYGSQGLLWDYTGGNR